MELSVANECEEEPERTSNKLHNRDSLSSIGSCRPTSATVTESLWNESKVVNSKEDNVAAMVHIAVLIGQMLILYACAHFLWDQSFGTAVISEPSILWVPENYIGDWRALADVDPALAWFQDLSTESPAVLTCCNETMCLLSSLVSHVGKLPGASRTNIQDTISWVLQEGETYTSGCVRLTPRLINFKIKPSFFIPMVLLSTAAMIPLLYPVSNPRLLSLQSVARYVAGIPFLFVRATWLGRDHYTGSDLAWYMNAAIVYIVFIAAVKNHSRRLRIIISRARDFLREQPHSSGRVILRLEVLLYSSTVCCQSFVCYRAAVTGNLVQALEAIVSLELILKLDEWLLGT